MPRRMKTFLSSDRKPIVYSCSGVSSVAQLGNHIALRMNRIGLAEMSCIVGIGGRVEPLVRRARSGRPIVGLDGCPLHCVRHCLETVDVTPDVHLTLTEQGIPKEPNGSFDPADADRVLTKVLVELDRV